MATSDRDALAEVLAELREDLYRRLRDGEDGTAYAIGAIEAIEDRLPDLVAQRDRRLQSDALREAADEVTEDGGAWDVLALYVDEAGHPYALEGIRRWLRERADRIEASE